MSKHVKKILIADADSALHKKIKKASPQHFRFDSAYDGGSCLKKLETFCPDLVIIDLFLPHIHGIEILRRIKTDPRMHHIGVILISSHLMLQNYYSALSQKADYCLEKPFAVHTLVTLFHTFFEGVLKPGHFEPHLNPPKKEKHEYHPHPEANPSYIKFWGTRGSNAVSGSEYVRFGGNTSCLEVRHHEDLLIIDAGTGIRPFGETLKHNPPKHIHLLFSHTHWDHIVGLPFFAPIYNPNCHISIWTPIGFEKTTREIFTEMLAYTYFPVRLEDISSTISFHEIKEETPFDIGPFEINTHYAFHAGSTLGFKIRLGKKTFGYVTDNEFLMGYHGNPKLLKQKNPLLAPYLSQIKFFKGCDFLVHEAQYTPEEYRKKVGWGHSSVSNAALLVKYAEVPEWIITHHDPVHTDLDLFKKTELQYEVSLDCGLKSRILMAADDMVVPL